MTSEGLARSRRLARRSELFSVFKGGIRRGTPRLEFIWLKNEMDHPRFAAVVPRFGHSAVDRNRLRRRIKERVRRFVLPNLSALDFVVRARPAAYDAALEEINVDLDQWLHSLEG